MQGDPSYTRHVLEHKDTSEVRAWENGMEGQTAQCVERYLELAKLTLKRPTKKVDTPCLDDHQFKPEYVYTKGRLSPAAARSVLKALFTARLVRGDCMWTVNYLARYVTKWSVVRDKRLHRLISYMWYTRDYVQSSHVCNFPNECMLGMFADASFAGDVEDSTSTSGMTLCLFGSRTFVPLAWLCRKQTAVSHSSTEAELVALEAALRLYCLPCLELWDCILDVFHPPKEKQSPYIPQGSRMGPFDLYFGSSVY